MSKACCDTDFINPKHNSRVAILNSNIIPITSAVTMAATFVTAILTASSIGQFCTINVPMIIFTGTGATLTAGPLANIAAPLETTYWTIMIDDGGIQFAQVSLDTSKIIKFTSDLQGTPFTNGMPDIIYPAILQYRSVHI